MPGRLQRDFRFGNLAEHLGVLLLKGIAAVAEVSRPEDVGFDAIATLLRPDDDDNYYAEDTFVVQLKAASATSLKFEGHGLDWLVGQSQPMFIGLVSLAESTISLYPTIHVNHAVLALHAEWGRGKFGSSDLPVFLRCQKWMAWKGEENHGAKVWLGEPLLSWSLNEIVDKDWINRTYSTLKRFLILARREIGLLELGQCSVVDWSTNDADSISAQTGMMTAGPGEIDSIAQQSAPFLRALMVRAMTIRPMPLWRRWSRWLHHFVRWERRSIPLTYLASSSLQYISATTTSLKTRQNRYRLRCCETRSVRLLC